MIFTVNLGNINEEKANYKWSVDRGTIVEGQNTPVIKVDTTGLDDTIINATIEIEGLPNNCARTASKTGVIAGCKLPITLDTYENLSLNDEKARLQPLISELQSKPDMIAFFIISFTKTDKLELAKSRARRITDYFKSKGVSKNKFKIVYSIGLSNYTTIYLLQPELINVYPDIADEPEKLLRQ